MSGTEEVDGNAALTETSKTDRTMAINQGRNTSHRDLIQRAYYECVHVKTRQNSAAGGDRTQNHRFRSNLAQMSDLVRK